MKHLISAVLLLLPLAQARLVCFTGGGTKSRATVRTHTTTTTTTVSVATVFTPTTVTGALSTYITIIGKTTITVPTGPQFTYAINAPTTTSSYPYFYPTRVDCTLFKTAFSNYPTTTTVPYDHSTFFATTLTSHVATSTAYAACATHSDSKRADVGPNIIRSFHGKPIVYYTTNGYVYNPYPGEPILQVIGLNAVKCCEFVQASNYTGFNYLNTHGDRRCYAYGGEWVFSTFQMDSLKEAPGTRFGNGELSRGLFIKFVP